MIVSAGRLSPLPVVVTVSVDSQVKAAADAIRAGEPPSRQVLVASCGGAMYAVDGLDTVEAYRMAGIDQIKCMMVEVAGAAEAMGMHLGLSRPLPVNPFCVMDAIRWMREKGLPLQTVDRRYIRLMELKLDSGVRHVFDTWLKRLAARLEAVPPFWHILGPLSEIGRHEQCKALESVMAFVHATGTVPDASSLRGILRQFSTTRQDRASRVAAIDEEAAAAPPPSPKAGGSLSPAEGVSRVLCDCGREWYLDADGRSIRNVQESDSMVVLTRQPASPVYPVPLDMAEHMDMGNSPVYHYVVPGSSPLVLFSSRRLDGSDQKKICQALRAIIG